MASARRSTRPWPSRPTSGHSFSASLASNTVRLPGNRRNRPNRRRLSASGGFPVSGFVGSLGEEPDVGEAGVVDRAQDRLDLSVVETAVGLQRDLRARPGVMEHLHGGKELLGIHSPGVGPGQDAGRAREDDPYGKGPRLVRLRLRVSGAREKNLAMLD